MSAVLEVRPDAVAPKVLAALGQALDDPDRSASARFEGPDGEVIALPTEIHALLVSVIESLKAGEGVAVVPIPAELATVEAAQLLNVSHPYLIQQIEAGAVPHYMVGTHRRLRLVDVLAYRDQADAQATAALDAMMAEAEDLEFYDG